MTLNEKLLCAVIKKTLVNNSVSYTRKYCYKRRSNKLPTGESNHKWWNIKFPSFGKQEHFLKMLREKLAEIDGNYSVAFRFCRYSRVISLHLTPN